MSFTINVTDTSGNPIDNAQIDCGGCNVTNAGNGFYEVGEDLTVGTAIVISAPGKEPTVYSWWTNLFTGGNVTLQDPKPDTSKW